MTPEYCIEVARECMEKSLIHFYSAEARTAYATIADTHINMARYLREFPEVGDFVDS